MAHQHLSQIIYAVVGMNADGPCSSRILRRHIVDTMADVIKTMNLMKDLDLDDGCMGRTIWCVSSQNLRSTAEELLVLFRRD